MIDLSPSRDIFLCDRRRRSNTTVDRIGVFDSGVGGLSVLRALRNRLPTASFVYVGDGACAPYGHRNAETVIGRCERIVEYLISAGVGMVVVACNTASVLAISHLRARWPAMQFVGVEPGIKPAVAATRTGRIAILATLATLDSLRMEQLVAQHAARVFVHLQPCPGVVEAIEAGDLNGASLAQSLEAACAPVRDADVDTVVLGCTHYPLIASQIASALGPVVRLIDTAAAVAERVASLWPTHRSYPQAPTLFLNTGACDEMYRLLQALPWRGGAEVSPLRL